MSVVRHLLAQRHFAALICVTALLMKLLVPSGYMIASDRGRIAITICSGTAPATMAMEMPGMHGDDAGRGKSKDHGKGEMPCAFSGLTAAAVAAADPIQLAVLIAFVLAIGLTAGLLPARSPPAYLRPPLRGPPASL